MEQTNMPFLCLAAVPRGKIDVMDHGQGRRANGHGGMCLLSKNIVHSAKVASLFGSHQEFGISHLSRRQER